MSDCQVVDIRFDFLHPASVQPSLASVEYSSSEHKKAQESPKSSNEPKKAQASPKKAEPSFSFNNIFPIIWILSLFLANCLTFASSFKEKINDVAPPRGTYLFKDSLPRRHSGTMSPRLSVIQAHDFTETSVPLFELNLISLW